MSYPIEHRPGNCYRIDGRLVMAADAGHSLKLAELCCGCFIGHVDQLEAARPFVTKLPTQGRRRPATAQGGAAC